MISANPAAASNTNSNTSTDTSSSSSKDATAIDATFHRRRLRIGFFKLCLIAVAFYTLFWMPLDDDSNDNDNILNERSPSRHHDTQKAHHRNKGHHDVHYNRHLAKKYGFKKHMDAAVEQIVEGTLESNIVWDRLAEMTDTFGPRIVGSDALEKSIDWIVGKVKADNLSVTTEDVVVDYWQRNQESLHFLSPSRGAVKLHILGLGYSVATPDPVNGLTAEVVVVKSKEELDQLGEAGEVKGKVVVWNRRFDSYDTSYMYRLEGAVWAEKHGAVAALVRALGPFSLQTPHTGGSIAAKIPTASISAEDADLLERSLKRHQLDPEQYPDWPKVKLVMGATTDLDARVSRNIIVELKGREKPEEVVVLGGHIDSWDVGSGAVDDGIGCFIAWEAIRQLSQLDRPPRRTVRVVFWTSEENTSVGGVVYAKNHPESSENHHVFAFESDTGVFDPYGIGFTPSQTQRNLLRDPKEITPTDYLAAAGEYFLGSREDLGYLGAGRHVLPNGGGADIEPLCERGVACAHFISADPFPLPYSTSPYALTKPPLDQEDDDSQERKQHHGKHDRNYLHRRHRHHHHSEEAPRHPVDSGYFYYHHTEADTMGAFTPEQAKQSAAVMAIWTYIAAESDIEF
ncbi:hypothetical protein BG015_012106 [Linnemannia schmuckeri]|uniref:Peptide hydrolase n=1 Tax=Linnemannia schmuckeri TaxID=64567 RepID=A0A9P5V7Q2_9FUNG|nr:hypothetical protein BG015_012106 [Linnemannia schmuckeri]